jgi:hypothetical protein
MDPIRLAIIVTGHGETESIPNLIRRIAYEKNPAIQIDFSCILRIPETSLKKEGELERSVETASRRVGGTGGIIIVMDCDWKGGCPANDGPDLLARAKNTRPDIIISVILAKYELESWFIAAAESLRGKRGLQTDLSAPAEPEMIRDAKNWLRNHMPSQRGYSETVDQPALAAMVDIQMARRADSFDKFYREVTGMLKTLSPSLRPN